MAEDRDLARLAALAGIEPRYRDETGTIRVTSPESKRGVLKALGLAADTSGEISDSLQRLQCARYARLAPPVVVVSSDDIVAVPLSLTTSVGVLSWDFVEETGYRQSGRVSLDELPLTGREDLDGAYSDQRLLVLPIAPAPGSHVLRLEFGDTVETLSLIVSHGRCHIPARLSRGPGVWGIAAQLYSLRSDHSWGIGDFTTLAEFVRMAASFGAGVVGLNPLHALTIGEPDRSSPYSPSSRVLLNVLYIDPAAVADFIGCTEARTYMESVDLSQLDAASRVDYRKVVVAKLAVLEILYRRFHARLDQAEDARGDSFRRFQAAGGSMLRGWATFEALSEHFQGSPSWQHWPAAYRRPDTPEVAAFVAAYLTRVEFFEYLQWIAEAQLTQAGDECRARNMAIGLYTDLALGVDHDSADVWSQGDLYAAGASIGAPPDLMNRYGQNWGIAPMNPLALKREAYAPFVSVLRAGMRHAGALRIDHAMSLQRLYWIPEGADPIDGAYVCQPFEDLIGVLANESQRHRCVVVGEDLGTVPTGFRQRMERARVLSYRPLFFQTDPHGEFMPPESYPRLSAAVVGTHDMATLPGFWQGRDLAVRRSIGISNGAETAEQEAASRIAEKRRLLAALARAGVALTEAAHPTSSLDEALVRAIHEFLARSPARLLMVRLEDMLGIVDQQNLPGTTSQHPNWTLRIDQDVATLAEDSRIRTLAELLRRLRPSAIPRSARAKVAS